uniref:Uncharacterized protein n=1 Tax=Anguilla anguilla TaxID=7936 RepID=A0A0E9SAI9_ANGAN
MVLLRHRKNCDYFRLFLRHCLHCALKQGYLSSFNDLF